MTGQVSPEADFQNGHGIWVQTYYIFLTYVVKTRYFYFYHNLIKSLGSISNSKGLAHLPTIDLSVRIIFPLLFSLFNKGCYPAIGSR